MSVQDEIRSRFDALDARERRFLLAGGFAVAVAVLFFGVVQPLLAWQDSLAARVAAEREQVSWMRGAVAVLRERGPARPVADTSGSLLALADSSARGAGLAQALRRIQQEGEDGVRVRLEGASFDAMILWLETLEQRHGATVSEMTVDRADGAGLVNASLTLTRAAS